MRSNSTFIVFEGIDGSGKTTLSNLVAQRLRESGLAVEHVREGGMFASSVTQAMRELGRDSRNLALAPRAELMLYLTREVQLVEEVTRGALARADVVIADRFVSTAEVLAIYGRGLPAAEVTPMVSAAVGGLEPDLTILVDVEPAIARARRQVSKLVSAERKLPSRKGMAGTALQRRLRAGYRELAARASDRWIVIDNTDAELAPTVDMLVDVVRTARTAGVPAARTRVPTRPRGRDAAEDVASARAALLAWIDDRAAREPGLAAYFLDGLTGADFDERRVALAKRAPQVIATGLKYLGDPVSWQLRRELVASAPGQIARSLAGELATQPEAEAMLRALVAVVPRDVASTLWGRDDASAWELRASLPDPFAVTSVGGVASERAWQLRDRWLPTARLDDPMHAAIASATVAAVEGARAWEIRKAARLHAPVAAIESTYGIADERAWRWRAKFLERGPKVVMRSLALLLDEPAWELRERAVVRCEEVMDTIAGLDDERAWALRERVIEQWPAAAVKSLGLLGLTSRGRGLIARALAAAPHDLAVWRQVVLRSQPGSNAAW